MHFGILYLGASQIGVFPMGEQGAGHPGYPKCGRCMVFVGQVMTSDVLDHGAGTTCALLCQDRGMAATAYEQT